MTSSFDNLCDQIIQYEKRVDERQRFVTALRDEIQRTKDAAKQAVANEQRLQEELLSKIDKCSELELNYKNLQVRETFLFDQQRSLQEENSTLKRDLASATSELEGEMMAFCNLVDGHSADLDLTSSGRQARRSGDASMLQRLLEEEKNLVTAMAEFEKQRKRVCHLESERHLQQQSLTDMLTQKKELEDYVGKAEEELQNLEEEKLRVARIPNSGPEFDRLRKELRSLNTDELERQCSELQHEVTVLQQQLQTRQRQQQQHVQQQQAYDSSTWQAQMPVEDTQEFADDFDNDDDDFCLNDKEHELPDLEEKNSALTNRKTAVSMTSSRQDGGAYKYLFHRKK